MKKFLILIVTILLCLLTAPALAETDIMTHVIGRGAGYDIGYGSGEVAAFDEAIDALRCASRKCKQLP